MERAATALSPQQTACRLLAHGCQIRVGRAGPLCRGYADVNLSRYGKGIVDLDTEVPNRAFDLGMAQQKLHRPQVPCTTVDQGSLGSSKRVCTEEAGVQPDAGDPIGDEPSVLPRREAPTWTTSASEQEFT